MGVTALRIICKAQLKRIIFSLHIKQKKLKAIDRQTNGHIDRQTKWLTYCKNLDIELSLPAKNQWPVAGPKLALALSLATARPNDVFGYGSGSNSGSDPVVDAFIGKIEDPRVLKQKFPFANFISKSLTDFIGVGDRVGAGASPSMRLRHGLHPKMPCSVSSGCSSGSLLKIRTNTIC